MKIIKYIGPSESVNVAPYGRHRLGEEKEYPDDFAAELIDNMKRNLFEVIEPVGAGHASDLKPTTEIIEIIEIAEEKEALRAKSNSPQRRGERKKNP